MTDQNTEKLLTKIKLSEQGFIKFIYERLGIVIKQHQTHELHKTILSAYHKFNHTPEEYLVLLVKCDDHSPLLEHLIIGVTVGETYFFRDKHQIELLKNRILVSIIQKKRLQNNLSLRIWSAGSATGEEIYTIVMLLYEMIPDLSNWTLNLLATDINTKALKKAIAGVYGEWSMRSIEDHYKQKFFTQNNREYTLQTNLRDLVHFDYLNLNEDIYPAIFNGTNAQDLILCRNVFIYFDNNKIAHFMKKLNACIVPGGYLMLGASDPVNIKDTDFIFHYHDGLIFTRPSESEKTETIKPVLAQPAQVRVSIPKLVKPVVQQIRATKKLTHEFKTEITELLHQSQWNEALNMISLYGSAENDKQFVCSAKATALANLGKLDEAEKMCLECLTQNSIDKNMYFTYALILIELNNLTKAEEILKKTIFLDHQFVPGHFQLGLLFLRQRNKDAGLKSLNNALLIANTKKANEEVIGSQGLNYGHLVEILKHEIELYTSEGNVNYANENA